MSFYLEISPRQTGKTYRLLKAVQKASEEGHRCVVWVPNQSFANIVKKDIPNGTSVCFTLTGYEAATKGRSSVRSFFDEWDICTDVPYVSTGYYATTLRALRKKVDAQEYLINNYIAGRLDVIKPAPTSEDLFFLLWSQAIITEEEIYRAPRNSELSSYFYSHSERGYIFEEEVYPDAFQKLEFLKKGLEDLSAEF